MSQWTHVAGAIRFDSLPIEPIKSEAARAIKAALEDGVPTGSEGPLQIRPGGTDSERSINTENVLIYGDLRHFGAEDVPEIEAWFKRVVEDSGRSFTIRQATLLVEVEYGPTFVFTAEDGKVKVERREPAEVTP